MSIPVNARNDLITPLLIKWLESKPQTGDDRAWRLQRGRRAERRTGYDVLGHFVAEVRQIVHVNDRRHLAAADRERLLEPDIDRAHEGERRAAVRVRAD